MTSLRQPGKRPRRTRSRAATYGAALALILLGAVLAVVGVTAQNGIPGRSYYNVTADFHNAANVARYAEVRVDGRRVGQVVGLSSSHGLAQVQLQLNDEFRPLRAGSTARLRLKGLLGAKYVDLTPSTHGAPIPDGGRIPASDTSTTVEVSDLIGSFDAKTRRGLRDTVQGLGTGFLGRGLEMNEAIAALPPVLRDLTSVARAVNARTGAAERLFPSAAAAAEAYDPVRSALAQGFAPWERSLRPYVDQRAALQAALEVAPSSLDAIRQGLAQNEPLLRETIGLARATVRMTRPAPAALRATTALLNDSRTPLRSAGTLLQRTRDAVPPTLDVARRTKPLIPPMIRNFEDNLPLLRALGGNSCDVLGWLRNWRSMLSWGLPSGNPLKLDTAYRNNTGGTVGDSTLGETQENLTGYAGPFPKKFCLYRAVAP